MNVELLDQIDRAISGLCPCGADPQPGSAYCGYDCEPNHVSVHTDQRETGDYATPMRWRPDLVTAVDDSDLVLLAARRRGPYNAQVFERSPELIHLRLDDGHRFVGVDVEPGDEQMPGDYWDRPNWAALERELGNSRHVEADPWGDVMRDYIERVDRYVLSDVETRFGLHIQSAGIVSIAPTGADPNDRSAWADLGFIADAGLTWSDDSFIRTDHRGGGTTDRTPVTMTVDNRYAMLRPSNADAGAVTHYDIEINAADGVPLLDALIAAESEAALRERARLLAAQSQGLAFSGLRERIGDALEELGRTMRPALEAFSRDAARRFPQPQPEPDHPMLAAIEARRNRNTGPEQRQRAPRQINPRRR